MASINNWTNDKYLTGSSDSDQIDNAANNVVINSYEGSDLIRNWGTNVTIDSGDDSDSFYNDSSAQNVIIDAGNGDDSIPNSGSLVTIRGGAGSDTIINLGTNVIIDAGDDNDVIMDGGGSEILINGGAGNDSIKIYTAAGNVTINTGEGNDTVDAWGSSLDSARVFQVGSGKNLIQLTNISSVSVTGGDGAEEVKIYSPIYTNQASLQSATFTGGAGNDTIYGTSVKDVFVYNGNDGNDVIVNYGGEDTILISTGLPASNITGSINGNDVVLNIATGTITLKDMKGHSITVTDVNGSTNTKVYGNTPDYTQKDAIKSFISSLDKTTLTDTEEALDEAVAAASKGKFTGIQNAIDNFISDCTNAADADTFLKYYCGILLDDADTGAITGWDVGGSTVKDADSIVPESGAASYPSGSSITKRGLTLTLPTGTLTTQQQNVIQGLNSWWLEESLKLVEESYGLSFYNDNVKFTSIDLNFYNNSNAFEMAYINSSVRYMQDNSGNKYDYNYYASLYINMGKVTADSSDENGGNLDRILAHEFTHVLQQANIDVDLPQFIIEGMGELIHGIDDWRAEAMTSLASNPSTLKQYLDLNSSFSGTENVYAAGYMFLHYLAKQSSDYYSSINETTPADTTPADTTNGGLSINNSAGNTLISGGSGNDTIYNYGARVTIDSGDGDDSISNDQVWVTINSGSGSDTIVNSISNVSINSGDGNDSIYTYNSSYVTIKSDAGDDTITFASSEGNNIIQYSNSDGADVINGLHSNDTIQISSGTYTTSTSGNDVILTIDNGSITLKEAANKKILIQNANGVIETLNSDGAVYIENNTSNVLIIGSSYNDTIKNTASNVIINSDSGDDSIENSASQVSIISDNGSNYIYNSGSNVTIDSGADKDTIISSGSNVTLNANTGSDLISLSSYAGNNVIEYAEGDGNDTIYGYGTDDTIYISSATYTTTASGSDTFIYVGDGFMMIKDAANTSLNIVDNNRDNTPADTTPADTTPADTTPADTTPAYDFTLTLTDKDKKTVKASSDVTIIDASARTKATKITANANNNTIIGGKGKDTVTFGNGLDLFMYSNGDGKDVITDYIEGEDIIEITSGTISSSSIKSSDVVFTIGSGSITVKKGKNKTVTIKDSDGNTSSRVYGNEMFITDADNAKVTAKSKVTLIDASARTEDIYIVGNSKANTIIGGTGNNTLKGGSGKDLFVYSAGNNIITDYKTGQDTIQLASASIISSTLNGSNVIINTDKGDITVNKAKNKKITVIDSEGNKTSQVYGEPTLPAGVTLNSAKTIMTVTDTFADDIIDLANYDKVKKVNAANLTSDVQIIGGSKAVSIKSGSGDDTLTGTAKNDTLTGGAGSDTFIYTGGKDVITDYSSEEDEIQISNGTVTKATVSGKNVKFTVAMASGTGALTIKNGKGKQIDLINSDGTVISETYTKTTKLNNFVEKINAEIFNSDNYISSDNTELDSIINLVTDDAVSTEELYNTSVDATSITQVTSAVYKKIDK